MYLNGFDPQHVRVQQDRPLVAQPQAHEVLVVELKLAQPRLEGGDTVVDQKLLRRNYARLDAETEKSTFHIRGFQMTIFSPSHTW